MKFDVSLSFFVHVGPFHSLPGGSSFSLEHLLGFHSFHKRRYSPSLSKLRSTEATKGGSLSGKRKTEHLQIISLSYVQMWSSPPHLRKPKENKGKRTTVSIWIYLDLPGSTWNYLELDHKDYDDRFRFPDLSKPLSNCFLAWKRLQKCAKHAKQCKAMRINSCFSNEQM